MAALLSLLRRSVGRRIGAVIGVLMGVSGIVGLVLVIDQTVRTQERVLLTQTDSLARAVAASFSSFDKRTGQHPIDDISAHLSEQSEVGVLDVFDAKGRIKWSSDVRRRGKMIDDRAHASLTSTTGTKMKAVSSDDVWVVFPLRRTSSCLPCHAKSPDPIGGLYVSSNNQRRFAEIVSFTRRAGAGVIAFVVLLTGLLLYLINRLVVSRLERLAGVMSKAEDGDFMVRVHVDNPDDEIGVLATTFNKMLTKITDLRVEKIETLREMSEVKDELTLKAELERKSELLEGTNERLNARLKQLSFLNQLGRDLASRLDLDYLLDLFCERIIETFSVPELAVLIFDRTAGRIEVVKARGVSGTEGQAFDVDTGISGEAIREMRPIYVPDLSSDRRIVAYRDSERAGSLLVVPMMYQGQPMGLLNFSSPEIGAFKEVDRELFVTVASQAALALANARLFQETLELSMTDGLTGILNRRAFESRLELEWSRSIRDEASLSMVMIDIDNFKVYNDLQGHLLGDETIRRVAHLLERNVRKVDAVARYGGEEFSVILPRAKKAEAVEVAKKLRRMVAQADFVRGYMQPLGRVTISCGVASAPADAPSMEALIKNADAALLTAKAQGRNRVCAYQDGKIEAADSESLDNLPAQSSTTGETAPD